MEWMTELLKQYVSEDKVEDALSGIKKALPEHFIPKEQYNKKVEALEVANSELDGAKKQMEEVNTKLTELSSSAEELESVKTALNESNQKYNDYLKETEQREADLKLSYQKNSTLEKLLRENKADDTQLDWLKGEFKLDEMSLTEDGSGLVGFDDVLKSVREKRPNSFVVEKTVDPSGEPVSASSSTESPKITSFMAGLQSATR
jgi:predicted acetyltransferase